MEIKPFFLTIDTEGDNIWGRPNPITSKNVKHLERFQKLCVKYSIFPIYLTNYEAANNSDFVAFSNHYKTHLEIGLHLHAWNSPPIISLTNDDFHYQPYLHEYPDDAITKKLDYLVKLLQDRFQTEIISHRGGRYSISEHIFSELVRLGIKVDCSFTPHLSWRSSQGNPTGMGGPNFTNVNCNIHTITTQNGDLQQIPVSTYLKNGFINNLSNSNYIKRAYKKFVGEPVLTLRSRIENFTDLKQVTDSNLKNNTHLEYILHSSELTAGFSPLMETQKEEDVFYLNLERFFDYLSTQNTLSLTFQSYLKTHENSRVV